MSIKGVSVPGARLVAFTLDPRTALDVWFHLHASLQSEETTRASRVHVAGLLPQLGRAIVDTGFVQPSTLAAFDRHLRSRPAAAPLDDTVRTLKGGA